MKNCLNCFYEPDWGEWVGKEYRKQVGRCKFKIKIPLLPATSYITTKSITRHSDDSGIITNCKAWKSNDRAIAKKLKI